MKDDPEFGDGVKIATIILAGLSAMVLLMAACPSLFQLM